MVIVEENYETYDTKPTEPHYDLNGEMSINFVRDYLNEVR
jgi:hypothetical protein